MNTSATLITHRTEVHTPKPLVGQDKVVIDTLYSTFGVKDGTPKEKNEVLLKKIQQRNFFALGGNETPEMELRANERIYLLQHAAKLRD